MSLGLRLLILGFLLSHAGCRGSATAAYVFAPGKNLRVFLSAIASRRVTTCQLSCRHWLLRAVSPR